MSKLANAVYAKETGRRAKSPLNSVTVTESWHNSPDSAVWNPRFLKEYRVEVGLRHNILLTEEIIHASESAALAEAIAMVKDAVIEEVFGEFRPHFRAINLALWNQDFDAALKALRVMEDQMFSREE